VGRSPARSKGGLPSALRSAGLAAALARRARTAAGELVLAARWSGVGAWWFCWEEVGWKGKSGGREWVVR